MFSLLSRIILVFLLGLSQSTFSQDFTYPVINATGSSLQDFIPEKWKILDSTSGDLNRDNNDDFALVLEFKDSIKTVKGENNLTDTVVMQPRMLVVLFYDPAAEQYYLREQSNTFIPVHDDTNMSDPYVSIKISRELLILDFQIFYSMGAWEVTNTTYKFRYHNKNFILIGADCQIYHRATRDFAEYSYNFQTQQRMLIRGNVNIGVRDEEQKRLNTLQRNLKTFSKPYTWKIEKGVYL